MDTIAVNGRIRVIEFIGCADGWGDDCWSGAAVTTLLVTRREATDCRRDVMPWVVGCGCRTASRAERQPGVQLAQGVLGDGWTNGAGCVFDGSGGAWQGR